MKINFEKDKNLLIDTTHSSNIFQRIKNEISVNENLVNFQKINYIKEELNWFIDNEPQIFEFYKKKFVDSIKNMVYN